MRPHMPEPFLGRFLYCVISGLKYVKDFFKKMHRDIKPSNILIKAGNGDARTCRIKLCDFGISGELVNSIAKTVAIGCEPFFAPERIALSTKSKGYSIQSDVWALGVTTLEIAHSRYPFNGGSKKGATAFKLIDEFGINMEPPAANEDAAAAAIKERIQRNTGCPWVDDTSDLRSQGFGQ